MENVLLELKNAEIIDFKCDNYAYGGCKTCDYGSEYINDFEIITTNYIIECKISDMYGYPIEVDFFIKFFCKNLNLLKQKTEEEFIEFLKNELNKLHDEKGLYYENKIEIKKH